MVKEIALYYLDKTPSVLILIILSGLFKYYVHFCLVCFVTEMRAGTVKKTQRKTM